MFTGLIERIGILSRIIKTPTGLRIDIDAEGWPERAATGESISVEGCCLTIASIDAPTLGFDVIPQTLECTTIGAWAKGRRVNLERAATMASLLGGHLVQGHVDGTGHIAAVERRAGEWRLRIEAPPEVAALLVPRGSIAVDGVSLTLAEVMERHFEVCLIPETLERTTLSDRSDGDRVNLEADALAKMIDAAVRRQTRSPHSGS